MDDFIKRKRLWFKAFEVLIEILLIREEWSSVKDRDIYKFQLIINYLNKPANDKVPYILN